MAIDSQKKMDTRMGGALPTEKLDKINYAIVKYSSHRKERSWMYVNGGALMHLKHVFMYKRV